MNETLVLIKLYAPVILALLLVILSVKLKTGDSVLFKLKFPFLEAEFPIKNTLFYRIILLTFSFICLSSYLYLDFTQYFDDHYEMEVFYDKDGLRRSLDAFTIDELHDIGYDERNDSLSEVYYEDLNKKLKEVLKYEELSQSEKSN